MGSVGINTPSPYPDTSNLHQECYICAEISCHLSESDPNKLMYVDISLGSPEEVQASSCPTHTSLVRSLQEKLDDATGTVAVGPESPPFGHWRPSDQLELTRLEGPTGARTSRLVVHRESTGQKLQYDLVLVKKPGVENHQGVAIIPDSDWIDLDRCRGWLSRCVYDHGGVCANPMKVIRQTPRLLIDIKRQCIVDGKPEHRYFALSYRIGKAGDFLLRPAILDELREENSLLKPEIRSSLQLTVRHAISLAETLGTAYLWLDVLCVVYGGETSVAEQLNHMSSIYSNAEVTIVVADGDGSDGIPGLRGISQPRNLQLAIFPFRDEQLLLRPGDNLPKGGKYHQRAWTHQEYQMSPRKLIIRFNQVHWVCSSCTCYEYRALAHQGKPMFGLPQSIMLDGIPDLQYMFTVVLSEYNKKALTYSEDAMSAVLGLLAVSSRTFTGGFLYGIPEMMFDAALGWDPTPVTTRRRKSDKPGHVTLGPSELPSWSWIGWEGSFKMRSTEPCEIASKRNPSLNRRETSPMVEWFTSDNPYDQSPRKIASTWLQDRDDFKDVGQPLLEGWDRQKTKLVDGSTELVYQHRALRRYGKLQSWKYPFPVPSIDTSTPLTNPIQTQYLFCKTWKTLVWIRRSTDQRRDFGRIGPSNRLLVCQNEHGPIIGTMYVGAVDNHLGEEAQCIDIVAISKFVEFGRKPDRKMIKVLWVTWEDNIAYRRASGELDEEVWHQWESEGKLENIDLVLG